MLNLRAMHKLLSLECLQEHWKKTVAKKSEVKFPKIETEVVR